MSPDQRCVRSMSPARDSLPLRCAACAGWRQRGLTSSAMRRHADGGLRRIVSTIHSASRASKSLPCCGGPSRPCDGARSQPMPKACRQSPSPASAPAISTTTPHPASTLPIALAFPVPDLRYVVTLMYNSLERTNFLPTAQRRHRAPERTVKAACTRKRPRALRELFNNASFSTTR